MRLKIAAPAIFLALLISLAVPAYAADSLAQVCNHAKPSVVCIMDGEKSVGSGVIVKIKSNYYVFTLSRFVGKEGERTVVLPDESSFTAVAYSTKAERGIAVLKIKEPKKISGAKTGKFEKLEIGQKVIALGLPDGEELTATFGIISALHIEKDAAKPMANYIITDALVNTLNYGGPLVNMRGEVVGICGPSRSGMALAIPIEYFIQIAQGATQPEGVTPQSLGLSGIQDLTYSIKIKYKIDKGAWIGKVDKNASAYEGGLRSGDVIIEVNGKPVTNADEFVSLIAKYEIGKKLAIKVVRKEGSKIVKKSLSIETAEKESGEGVSLYGETTQAIPTVTRSIEPEEIAAIVRKAMPNIASIGSTTGGPSGFVILQNSKYSWLVTDAFAVGSAKEVTVRFALSHPDKKGKEYIQAQGEVIGVDKIRGIAVIQVARKNTPTAWSANTERKTPVCSQVVIAGSTCQRTGMTSSGVISASRNINAAAFYPGWMLTDALINSANRGAPVLDINGALVGMAVKGKGGYNAMGAIVPLKELKKIARELVKNGQVERGYIGIKALFALSAEDRKKLKLNIPVGLRIGAVIDKSPAAQARLSEGTILLKFNGQWIRNAQHLKILVATAEIGKYVDIEIAVDGVRKTIRIQIGKKQD